MRPIVNAVAGLLEQAQTIDPDATVQGLLDEQHITFAFKLVREGSMTLKWTEATVPAPAGLQLTLSVQPSTLVSQREIRRGLVVVHVLGDAPFDAAFIVEGAPEAVVRELMDEKVRAGVLSLGPSQVISRGNTLSVQVLDWVEDPERAATMVRMAARLGAIASEIARRNQADTGRLDTSGYRGAIGKGARALEQQEIEAIERAVAARRKGRQRGALLAGLVIGGVCVAIGAAAVLLGR